MRCLTVACRRAMVRAERDVKASRGEPAARVASGEHDTILPGHHVSPAEGRAMFDRQARRYLGISGDEFVRRWEAGKYAGAADVPGVMDLVLLLPLVPAGTSLAGENGKVEG